MGVYDPNAPAITKPTKLASPVMVGGDKVWEEPYNRVQMYGSVLPPINGRWRMYYIYQYGYSVVNGPLVNAAYAEAANPAGPWTKPNIKTYNGLCGNAIIGDQPGLGVYYDHYVGMYRGAGGFTFGESVNGAEWPVLNIFPAGPKNDTSVSLIRHQPLSPNSGNPFIATVREQGTWANGTLRRAAYMDSGDFNAWSQKQVFTQLDAPDGWDQPYASQLTSYGDKLLNLQWWLHLDNIPGNNNIGVIDAELMYLTVPPGARYLSECGPWTRTYQPFLSAGAAGAMDAGGVQPAPIVIHDGTVYVFYTAWKQKHGITIQPNDLTIGLATMPQAEFDSILS